MNNEKPIPDFDQFLVAQKQIYVPAPMHAQIKSLASVEGLSLSAMTAALLELGLADWNATEQG